MAVSFSNLTLNKQEIHPGNPGYKFTEVPIYCTSGFHSLFGEDVITIISYAIKKLVHLESSVKKLDYLQTFEYYKDSYGKNSAFWYISDIESSGGDGVGITFLLPEEY